MRRVFYFVFLFSVVTLFTNCSDDSEDLTIEIVGEYLGAYGSNDTGDINPYEIIISRVSDDRISIRPKTGTEFSEWETDIERINSSTISAKVGQTDPTIAFAISSPPTLHFTNSNFGSGSAFTGEKQ
ncbi:MAG: hypothetical protein ACPG49_10195 [Chitinophagales bacterium]